MGSAESRLFFRQRIELALQKEMTGENRLDNLFAVYNVCRLRSVLS